MKRLAMAALLIAGLALIVVIGGSLPEAAQAQDEAVTRVLVWEWTPNDDGVFEMLSTDGNAQVIVDFPNGVFDRRAQRCGQHFWAADGSGAVIFTGAKDGDITLYRPDGNNTLLGHASRMACAGPNRSSSAQTTSAPVTLITLMMCWTANTPLATWFFSTRKPATSWRPLSARRPSHFTTTAR